jgi:hypothetical protein
MSKITYFRTNIDFRSKLIFKGYFNLLDEVMNGIERRHADRLQIIGANVIYTLNNGQFGLQPLNDLTMSSARFEIDHIMKDEDIIELELIIPGEDKVYVKGKVIRLSNPAFEHPPYVVIQFLPFGTDERYNSMQSYEQLKNLIDKYLQTVD